MTKLAGNSRRYNMLLRCGEAGGEAMQGKWVRSGRPGLERLAVGPGSVWEAEQQRVTQGVQRGCPCCPAPADWPSHEPLLGSTDARCLACLLRLLFCVCCGSEPTGSKAEQRFFKEMITSYHWK